MSDEEKTKEELKRLYKKLYETDKEFEKAKGKRFIITMLIFTAFYFVVIMAIIGFDIRSAIEAIFSKAIIGILAILFASVMLAWFHFWANAAIFGQLSDVSSRERKIIDGIASRIKELEKKLED